MDNIVKVYEKVRDYIKSKIKSDCDADDVIQEIFAETLRKGINLTWDNLKIIAFGRCIDYHRKTQREDKHFQELNENIVLHDDFEEKLFFELDLRRILNKLKIIKNYEGYKKDVENIFKSEYWGSGDLDFNSAKRQKKLFILLAKIYGNRSYKEIAEILGVSYKSVEKSYNRMIFELRSYFKLYSGKNFYRKMSQNGGG